MRIRLTLANGTAERPLRTLLYERLRVERRKAWFEVIEKMQVMLVNYLFSENARRPGIGEGAARAIHEIFYFDTEAPDKCRTSANALIRSILIFCHSILLFSSGAGLLRRSDA